MKRLIVLINLFILTFSLHAQDNDWQSLNKKEIQLSYEKDYQKALEVTVKALQLAEKEFGKGHKNYCTSLGKIAKLYEKTGELEKAKSTYIELIDLKKKVEGDNKQAYVYYYKNLANLYYISKEYSKAELLFIEIVEIEKQTTGDKSIEYATALSNLAWIYITMNNYPKAIPLYNQLFPIKKKLLGDEDEDYLKLLQDIAFLYYDSKYYSAALPLFTEIAAIVKKRQDQNHPDYAVWLEYQAKVHDKINNIDEALKLYSEVSEIYKKAFGENSPEYAYSLNGLALMYKKTGNYNTSESLYRKSIAIYKKMLSGYYHDYAQSLSDLASLYVLIDKNSEAEALLLEAISILKGKPVETQNSYAGFLNELAILYRKLGNYDKAEALFLESSEIDKKIYGENHQSYAQSLNNLGTIYEMKEEYLKAERLYIQSLEIKKSIFGDDHPDYGLSLGNLASLYVLMGEYSKAEDMLIKSASIYKNKKGENHPDYAISILNLANLNQQTGQYAKAETQYLHALDIFKKVYGTKHNDYVSALNLLASLYEAMGKYSKAEPLHIQTNEQLNNQIKQNFAFMSDTEKEMFINSISYYFDIFHSFAFRYKNKKPEFVALNYNNELAHKGMILKNSIALQQVLMNINNAELKSIYNELLNIKKTISDQSALPIDKRTKNTDSLENIANTLEKNLNTEAAKLPEYKLFQDYQESPGWADIQKKLKPDEAAIEFVRFYYMNEKNWTDSIFYCALVLRKEYKYPKMVYLCEERELINCMSFTSDNNKSIDDFYSLNGAQNNQREKGYSIYKYIWQPIENLLEGAQNVYITPAGLLHKISFNAIPTPDKKYLSDKYTLHMQISTAAILSKEINFNLEDLKNSVIYGGIDYSTPVDIMFEQSKKIVPKGIDHVKHFSVSEAKAATRGGSWSYLSGTLKEAQGIENLFQKSKLNIKILSGHTANEESFKALNGNNSPSIIHIATHGFFIPDNDKEYYKNSKESLSFMVSENPLIRSGLLFSGANTVWNNISLPSDIEDGILTAQEISQLYLPNTKLVVMSACETGLGQIKSGEGVFGLQRSFKMAGVDYIIMSLWQVPDEQTSELMQAFYKNWLGGQNIREAFTAAQNQLKEQYRDSPYLWAAFVLIE